MESVKCSRKVNRKIVQAKRELELFTAHLIDDFIQKVLGYKESKESYEQLFYQYNKRYQSKVDSIKQSTRVGMDAMYFHNVFKPIV